MHIIKNGLHDIFITSRKFSHMHSILIQRHLTVKTNFILKPEIHICPKAKKLLFSINGIEHTCSLHTLSACPVRRFNYAMGMVRFLSSNKNEKELASHTTRHGMGSDITKAEKGL